MPLGEPVEMCSSNYCRVDCELLEVFPIPIPFVLDPTDDLQTNILQPHDRHVLTIC